MKQKKQPLDYKKRIDLRNQMDTLIAEIRTDVKNTPELFTRPDDMTTDQRRAQHVARQAIDMKIGTVRGIAKQLGVRRPFDQLPININLDETRMNALDDVNTKIKELTVRIDKNLDIVAAHPEYESLVFCDQAHQLKADMEEFEKLVGMSLIEFRQKTH